MEFIFYLHASIAVLAMGWAMLTPHAIHALLSAVLSLLSVAVSLYSLSAHLASALLVIIYAGAIMVLFVFAIMLLRTSAAEKQARFNKTDLVKAIAVFGAFWAELVFVLKDSSHQSLGQPQTLEDIAKALFSTYGYMVEVVSFVLLAGLVTAIFVAQGLRARAGRVET